MQERIRPRRLKQTQRRLEKDSAQRTIARDGLGLLNLNIWYTPLKCLVRVQRGHPAVFALSRSHPATHKRGCCYPLLTVTSLMKHSVPRPGRASLCDRGDAPPELPTCLGLIEQQRDSTREIDVPSQNPTLLRLLSQGKVGKNSCMLSLGFVITHNLARLRATLHTDSVQVHLAVLPQ